MTNERDEMRELFAEAVTEPRPELREAALTAVGKVRPRRRRRTWLKVALVVAAIPLLLGAGVASGLLPLPWPVEGTLYYRSASKMGPGWSIFSAFPALTGQSVVDESMPSSDADPSPVNGDIVWAPTGMEPQAEMPILLTREGGTQVNLTEAAGIGGHNCRPKWSPDGTRIAFQHAVVPDGVVRKPLCEYGFHVWVMNADGSDARPVVAEEGPPVSGGVWFPDGKRLLVDVKGETDKYELHLASGRLTPRPEFNGAGSWSPDGKWLAATPSTPTVQNGRPGRLNQLVIMDAEGGNRWVLAEQFIDEGEVRKHYPTKEQLQRNITNDWIGDLMYHVGPNSPQWSPEGDKVAFLAALPFDPNGRYYREQVEVWIYDLKADELVRVTNDNEAQYSLVWRKPRK